jgi:hypothetical protein
MQQPSDNDKSAQESRKLDSMVASNAAFWSRIEDLHKQAMTEDSARPQSNATFTQQDLQSEISLRQQDHEFDATRALQELALTFTSPSEVETFTRDLTRSYRDIRSVHALYEKRIQQMKGELSRLQETSDSLRDIQAEITTLQQVAPVAATRRHAQQGLLQRASLGQVYRDLEYVAQAAVSQHYGSRVNSGQSSSDQWSLNDLIVKLVQEHLHGDNEGYMRVRQEAVDPRLVKILQDCQVIEVTMSIDPMMRLID